MRIGNDDLKTLYQSFAASRMPRNRTECPAPEDIAESFESSASRRNRKMIIDHISRCPYCYEEFMLLLEYHRQRNRSPENVVRKRASLIASLSKRIAGPASWQYICLFLGLSLSLASVLLLVHQNAGFRVTRTDEAIISLSSPKPNQAISEPFIFRWQRYPATEYYILEIFNDSLLPVWTSDKVLENSLQIPPPVFSRLSGGSGYYWMVTAYTQGCKVMESNLARFTIIIK